LAAVLGGTQSLHTDSFDEALALPTESAVTVALRTQQILAEESGVTNTIDPLGGSYFVEALTDKIERDALAYIERIDEMGGMIAAIERGFPQKEIADASYHYQRQVDRGDKTIVGVNKYTFDGERRTETLKIGDDVERAQLARLAEVKARRDEAKLRRDLAALAQAASTDQNLIPFMLACVRNYGTVQELSQALVPVFGTYREVSVL
jgi:methylmalonyl-CoA mutase N-terminal domain/subunit